MSTVRTCLVIVHDASRKNAWILDSLTQYFSLWAELESYGIRLEPLRFEQHEVFILNHPLTADELLGLEQVKRDGLIENWYVHDEITQEVFIGDTDESYPEIVDPTYAEIVRRLGFDPRRPETLKDYWRKKMDNPNS